MATAEQVTEPLTYHGEGAVWYEPWGGLKWVDMLAGDVLSLDRRGGTVTRQHVDSPIAAMLRPRVGGGFVVATEREFALWNADGCEWRSPPIWTDPDRRFNEGGCDASGRLLCGMKSTVNPGRGELFRLNPDRTIDRMFGNVTISNGLGFSADRSLMYYIDSRTRRVDVFDVDPDGLRNRRPFVTIPDGFGGPDGLWVDDEDGVWVALFGGGAVRHYDSEGVLREVVEVPATQVSSCTFGGDDLHTLYITTSRENLAENVEPLAGSVFSFAAGVRGQPVLPFAG